MKLIVGLGNPGPRYAETRHNVGFKVVDILASRWRVDIGSEKFHGWFGLGEYAGERVGLLKPATFMNRSGQAVMAAGRFYKLLLSDLLVIVDDLALPPGRLRVRAQGSAGGHNGLKDIVERLGSEEWCRLRIGIGEAVGDSAQYVLSRFTREEQQAVDLGCQVAADAAECWIREGVQAAMNQYNGK